MNSFTVMAIGNLARDPELGAKGDMMYTRFCLVGNDWGGRDEQGAPRQFVTFLWFVAFGSLGEAIARRVRKGDQLVVYAQIRANNWTDVHGEKQYDYSFVVQGFKFAAPGKVTREALAAAHAQQNGQNYGQNYGESHGENGYGPNGGQNNGQIIGQPVDENNGHDSGHHGNGEGSGYPQEFDFTQEIEDLAPAPTALPAEPYDPQSPSGFPLL